VGMQVMTAQLARHSCVLTAKDKKLFDNVWKRVKTKMTTAEFVEYVITSYQLDIASDVFLENFYSNYIEGIKKAEPLPGALDALKYCAKHYKVALVTASKREQALAILSQNGWTNYFDIVIGNEEYQHHKPAPDSFLLGAKKLTIKPEECVVIEDSGNGIKAANSAEMTVVGVQIGNVKTIEPGDVTVLIKTLEELSTVLKNV